MPTIGIDLESVSRITNLVSQYDRTTLELLFTPRELDQCSLDSHYYALCFCTKEAVGKALGTGLAEIQWTDIETTIDRATQSTTNPLTQSATDCTTNLATSCTTHDLTIHLSGIARQYADTKGLRAYLATGCCWDDYAMVHVLLSEENAL